MEPTEHLTLLRPFFYEFAMKHLKAMFPFCIRMDSSLLQFGFGVLFPEFSVLKKGYALFSVFLRRFAETRCTVKEYLLSVFVGSLSLVRAI